MLSEKKTRVLFFCKHNSCRSQMAEALLKHLAGDRFDVYSAGLSPKPIHPCVYTALEEIGVSMAGQTSKSVDLYLGRQPFDEIIIVCQEGEAECPRLYPFALRVERWPFPDPANLQANPEQTLQAFRETRDTILEKIKLWLSLRQKR